LHEVFNLSSTILFNRTYFEIEICLAPQEILQGLQMPVVALQFCDSATSQRKNAVFLEKKSVKKSDTRAGVGGKNIT
jgi:hypothetical protein